MIPRAFEYFDPPTLEEAVGLLERYGDDAKLMAGGQSLLPMMKLRVLSPAQVVDLWRVPDLDYIRRDDGVIRIGAMTTHYASVINFRTAGERGATVDAGQAAAEAAGLRYHHLPFREASAEVAEAFLATVGDPSNQPAFIHCGSANRVGAMWLIKRVKQDGWTVDDALAEAETIGLRSEALREFALAYVRDGA